MKTIRLLVVLMVLAVLGLMGTASAETYVVKKGDCLSKIGKQFQVSWKVIHWENRETIKDPNKIFPGQEVIIPDSSWAWEKVRGNPFRGSFSEGLDKINVFDADMNKALTQKYESGNFEEIFVPKGKKVKATIYGNDIVRRDGIILWEGMVREYRAQVERDKETLECSIAFPSCGNPTQLDDCKRTPKEVEPTREEIPEAVAPIETRIVLEVPKTLNIPKVLVYKKIQCRDYELNAGAGPLFGSRGGMRDIWGYAEGILPWSTCYYFGQGPGFYINGDIGSVDSGYGWGNYGLGYQHGFRYLDHTVDKDGVVHEYGTTTKLRLVWKHLYGSNAPYEMDEDALLLGLYDEFIYQLDQKTLVGITFEGWLSLWSEIDSTWSGDKPSNQGRAAIGGFIQRRINDDWQARAGASIFYQAWDENFGLGMFAEARYHEWLMLGVAANFLFDGGTIVGPYCRVEKGNYIRSKRDKEIIAGIVCIKGCDDEAEESQPVAENENLNPAD